MTTWLDQLWVGIMIGSAESWANAVPAKPPSVSDKAAAAKVVFRCLIYLLPGCEFSDFARFDVQDVQTVKFPYNKKVIMQRNSKSKLNLTAFPLKHRRTWLPFAVYPLFWRRIIVRYQAYCLFPTRSDARRRNSIPDASVSERLRKTRHPSQISRTGRGHKPAVHPAGSAAVSVPL